MPGVRIRHATDSSATYILVDPRRRYRAPYDCPVCFLRHDFKTYHIRLDGNGTAVVSQEVWDRLASLPGTPFSYANAVDHPPTIRIGLG